MGNTKVITLSQPFNNNIRDYYLKLNKKGYWRISLYEYKGDPEVACFCKDMGKGFYDYRDAIKEGKRLAKELNYFFMENVTMGDSIMKIYCKILE